MNFGFQYLEQIRALRIPIANDEPMSTMDRAKHAGGGFITEAFNKLMTSVLTAYHIEHNPDDTHGTIHATGTISERRRTTPMGEWITIPFGSLTFMGSGTMAWTPTAANTTVKYMLIGKTVFLLFNIGLAAVTAPVSTQLILRLPTDFFQAVTVTRAPIRLSDNGTLAPGEAVVDPSQNPRSVFFVRQDAANFTASAATTSVNGEFFYEVA